MHEDEIPVGKADNLTGKKFDKLTVLYRVKNNSKRAKWKCQCECGNIVEVTADGLKRGATKSCGCLKSKYPKGLVGYKFERLLVIADSGKRRNTNGEKYWHCLCDCGNECDILTSSLVQGLTKSCGCLKNERTQKWHERLLNQKFNKLTVIEFYGVNEEKRVLWKCRCDCGNEVITDSQNLVSGNIGSCGCLNSKGNAKIQEILNLNNISFKTEATLNCRYPDSKYLAKFDFYVNNSYLIEFDGQQHFKSVEAWGGEERFQEQQKRDNYKNQWCKDNNIPLIRIPYAKLDTLCIEDLMLETTQFRVV